LCPGQQSAAQRHPSYASHIEEEGEISCTEETVRRAWHSEFQGQVVLADRAEVPLPRQDWEVPYQEGRGMPRNSTSQKVV